MRPLLALFCLAIIGALTSCGAMFDCVDTIKSQTKSPSGKNTLVIFERDCGATAPISTIVSLVADGTKFDGNKSNIALVIRGQALVSITWANDGEASITYPASMDKEVFKKEDKVGDIVVKYEKKP